MFSRRSSSASAPVDAGTASWAAVVTQKLSGTPLTRLDHLTETGGLTADEPDPAGIDLGEFDDGDRPGPVAHPRSSRPLASQHAPLLADRLGGTWRALTSQPSDQQRHLRPSTQDGGRQPVAAGSNHRGNTRSGHFRVVEGGVLGADLLTISQPGHGPPRFNRRKTKAAMTNIPIRPTA